MGGCVCDELWVRRGQGESGLLSKITVGSLSNSRFTTYGEQIHIIAQHLHVQQFILLHTLK